MSDDSLITRLANMKDDEADKYLAEIWKSFRGSEQHQALELALRNLARMHEPALNSINATDAQRSFACGFTAAAKTLANVLQTAFDYVPPPSNIQDASFEIIDGGRDHDEQKFDDDISSDPTVI